MNFWLKSAYVSPQTIRSIRSIMIHQYIYVDEIDFIRVCFPSISAEENLVFLDFITLIPFDLMMATGGEDSVVAELKTVKVAL